jgi:uncharacterized LabA/DUF88 family protein
MIPSITLSQLHHQGSGPSFSFCGRPTLGKSAKRRGCDYKGGQGFVTNFRSLTLFVSARVLLSLRLLQRSALRLPAPQRMQRRQFAISVHSVSYCGETFLLQMQRVLIFVDESNVVSAVRAMERKLDWLKLRDHLVNAGRGRELIEMVIYAGLPPPMPEWQTERDKKNKFLHWLRSNGFLVVIKEGSPGDGKYYKANVDVLMAIDAVELSVEICPDVVVLVTGDADFAHLALQLRRRGIRVEAAATAQTLGAGLKGAANDVIDLVPLFETFEVMKAGERSSD